MNIHNFISELNKDLKSAGIETDLEKTKIIFKTFINVLRSNIVKGKDVKISDFGTFKSKLQEFTLPTKGKTQSWVIKFIPSRYLKRSINAKT